MTHDEELGARARAMLADFRSDRAPPPQLAAPMLAAIEARLAAPPTVVPDAPSTVPQVTTVARRLGLRGWFVVGGLAIGAIEGAAARIDGLASYRGALPFVLIIVALIWLRRRRVWDEAR